MADSPGYEVVLQPSGWRFVADGAQTVLRAARLAGIRLPSSCRNGTCRACLCRLEQGAVRYAVPWPGLSADEKALGYILPCVALPDADLALDVPGASRLETGPPRPLPLTGARR